MDKETMQTRLAECGIPVDGEKAEQLQTYHTLLMDWNTRMDLTAVTEEGEMLDRHYVDALSILRFPQLLPQGSQVIDVGTGAGFPGLPLAIVRPDLKVTLLDALQKRLSFLQAVVDALGLKNVQLVHSRAEDGGRNPALREQFDVAVARAVAGLPVLAEYLLPYVRVGGYAVCWKGPAVGEEMAQGKRAARLLGGQVGAMLPVTFPGRDWEHVLVPIRKKEKTLRQYPRKAGTPGKQPLGEKDMEYRPLPRRTK